VRTGGGELEPGAAPNGGTSAALTQALFVCFATLQLKRRVMSSAKCGLTGAQCAVLCCAAPCRAVPCRAVP
jgi:hypothetical protein